MFRSFSPEPLFASTRGSRTYVNTEALCHKLGTIELLRSEIRACVVLPNTEGRRIGFRILPITFDTSTERLSRTLLSLGRRYEPCTDNDWDH